MPTILLNRGSDQFPSYEAVGKVLRRLYGERGRMEIFAERGMFGSIYMAFVVATIEGGPVIVDHPIDEGKAQLEWWQQDHVLCGFGRSRKLGQAVDEALAAAKRGKLEQLQITMWFSRMAAKFQAYHRSPRGSDYMPTGRAISRLQFGQLVT